MFLTRVGETQAWQKFCSVLIEPWAWLPKSEEWPSLPPPWEVSVRPSTRSSNSSAYVQSSFQRHRRIDGILINKHISRSPSVTLTSHNSWHTRTVFRSIPTYVITVPERHRQTDRQRDDILWHNRALRRFFRLIDSRCFQPCVFTARCYTERGYDTASCVVCPSVTFRYVFHVV